MVSMRHEVLVDLFRNRPSLVAEILVEVLGVVLPTHSEARVASIDLTETQSAEYRADIVILLLDHGRAGPGDHRRGPALEREDKPFTWPAYLTVSRDRHRCPAGLLVVAPDPIVADWSAQPIEIGVAGFVLRPPVLRRNGIPVVTDPAEATRRPELGVLSVMAYGDTEQARRSPARCYPRSRDWMTNARVSTDLVYNPLNEAARRALEAMMKGYEYQSDFAKKYVALGRTGRGGSARSADCLRVRGITVPDAARERILAQKDPERLQRWLEKAIVAASFDEVLGERS